ncbi:hypothetical protein KVR01_010623 [Diaporthe batatas]|uniref:uncharacterized protein n=1 Tax=Diaporthe batatas TaxID=748121 RepID=UPI001D04DA8C|nr:uncharacterized protein KVR01_010623 [Diaporthe batatas]KAG8159986.1 hypothetical protein KVR01_010623 [Diaporthe batatas]
MEGVPNKFVHLVDFCCLGRRKKHQEPIELTPPSRNAYGQKLMQTLEHRERRGGPSTTTPNKADVSKPLPVRPPGRASLDLGRPGRPSADLSDLVGSDAEDGAVPHRYDRAWYEFLGSLHNALKHTRYSISGRMGMSVWGCSSGARSGLSVVCPAESRQAVKLWCLSSSGRFSLTDSEPDVLVFQAPGSARGEPSPSRTWRIRIRWLREPAFEAMPKVEMALRYDDGNPYAGEQVAEVNVLTLPALLDNCAAAWVEHVRRHGEGADDRRIRGIEEDVFSILERVMDLGFAEQGSGPLTALECRHVVRASFWAPFTAKHADSPAMFALCGLPLPQDDPTTTTTTAQQTGPGADTSYVEDTRFSNPRPAPAVPPKDAGRDLTASARRQPAGGPAPKSSPIHASFLDLFKTPSGRREPTGTGESKQRRHAEDARRLEEQVSRGARRLADRERERKGRDSGSSSGKGKGKGKEREGRDGRGLTRAPSSRLRDDGKDSSTPRSSASHRRAVSDSASGPVTLGKGKERERERESSRRSGADRVELDGRGGLTRVPSSRLRDGGKDSSSTPRSSVSHRRAVSDSASGSGPITLPDGTKVSYFDSSALERTASGQGRVPTRGHFADLFIVDDGEAL